MAIYCASWVVIIIINVRMVLKDVKEMNESAIRMSGEKGFGLISMFLSVSQENLSLVLT